MKSLIPSLILAVLASPVLLPAAEPVQLDGFREKARVLGFSPDGNTLLAMGLKRENGNSNAIIAYDLQANTSQIVVDSSAIIHPVAISPGTTSVCWFDQKASSLSLADVATSQVVKIADDGPRFAPDEFCFGPDGKMLFEARRTEPVRVWDTKDGKQMAVFGNETEGHMWVQLTADGKRLLIAGTDNGKFLGNGKGLLQIWDPVAAKKLVDMELEEETRICAMARIAPDGKAVVAAEFGKAPQPQLTLWDAHSGRRRALLDDAVDMRLIMASGKVDSGLPIVFTADGSLLATMTSKAIKVWNVADGKLKHTLPVAEGVPYMIAAAPSGTILAVSYGDPMPRDSARQPELAEVSGRVQIWDAATGTSLTTLAGSVPYPKTIAFSQDGARLATASYTWKTGPADVFVWDVGEWVPKQQRSENSPTPESTPVRIEPRTWTDTTGKFQVKAKFVASDGTIIKLERVEDGKVISVPLQRLSAKDQQHVRELRSQLTDPKN